LVPGQVKIKIILFLFVFLCFKSPDASELSWTYPLHGIPFNWIHQRNEPEDQLQIIECVSGERIEQQLEFELNRQLFHFDNRHLNSKNKILFFLLDKIDCLVFVSVKKNPTAIEDYTIINETTSNQDFIQNSVGIQLLKRDNEKLDIVRFNIVYTPTKFIM
jgi:hypothetical protein